MLLFFFHAAADDCPNNLPAMSQIIDKLKLMVDLKPKVIEDATAIRDKFPCNDEVLTLLGRFVSDFDF